jgi:DNA (cytosine-5)-methyltransferase 1/site-specific DNA-methyltransferase (adenine-specific)
MKQIPDSSIDMILVDIPYEITRKTNFKSIKDFTKKTGETEYSCMDFGNWDIEFNVEESIKEAVRIVKDKKSIIVFSAWQQLEKIRSVYDKNVPKNKKREPRIGVWEKSNPSVFNMQRMAIQPFEFFIWLGIGSNLTFNNQNEGKPERHYFKTSTQRGLHPTLKPIEIMEHLIKTYTNEKETVLDFTMGSGTTGVACVNTNRKFIGIEKDENYFNIAQNRIMETITKGCA